MKKGVIGNRGLSEVVTTVLIILLVLAAIIILWAFAQTAIKKSASQITGECLTLSLQPLVCDNAFDGTTYQSTTVKVKRNAGEGNLKIMQFIFNINGEDIVRNASTNLPELETETQRFTNLGSAPSEFTVAGVIETDVGTRITCNEVSPRFICNKVTGLSTPTGLTETASTGKITLSWSAVTGATGYRIYKEQGTGGDYAEPYIASDTASPYDDNSVTAGTEYCYKISAYNSDVESSKSSEDCVTAV